MSFPQILLLLIMVSLTEPDHYVCKMLGDFNLVAPPPDLFNEALHDVGTSTNMLMKIILFMKFPL